MGDSRVLPLEDFGKIMYKNTISLSKWSYFFRVTKALLKILFILWRIDFTIFEKLDNATSVKKYNNPTLYHIENEVGLGVLHHNIFQKLCAKPRFLSKIEVF
jgi:hypothetical protein